MSERDRLWALRCEALRRLVAVCRPPRERWHERFPLSSLVERHPLEYAAYQEAQAAYDAARGEEVER